MIEANPKRDRMWINLILCALFGLAIFAGAGAYNMRLEEIAAERMV